MSWGATCDGAMDRALSRGRMTVNESASTTSSVTSSGATLLAFVATRPDVLRSQPSGDTTINRTRRTGRGDNPVPLRASNPARSNHCDLSSAVGLVGHAVRSAQLSA